MSSTTNRDRNKTSTRGQRSGGGSGRRNTNTRGNNRRSGAHVQTKTKTRTVGSGGGHEHRPIPSQAAAVQNDHHHSSAAAVEVLRDEDVLIAFAPYVRNETNVEALQIQQAFQITNDSNAFVNAARQFLLRQSQSQQQQQKQSLSLEQQSQEKMTTIPTNTTTNVPLPPPLLNATTTTTEQPTMTTATSAAAAVVPKQSSTPSIHPPPSLHPHLPTMVPVTELEKEISGLTIEEQHDDDDEKDEHLVMTTTDTGIVVAAAGRDPGRTVPITTNVVPSVLRPTRLPTPLVPTSTITSTTPPSRGNWVNAPPGLGMCPQRNIHTTTTATTPTTITPMTIAPTSPHRFVASSATATTTTNSSTAGSTPLPTSPSNVPLVSTTSSSPPPPSSPSAPTSTQPQPQQQHVYQPKRLWTRLQQQPGQVLANNVPFGSTLKLRPRQELTAQWMLPLGLVRQYGSTIVASKQQQQRRGNEGGMKCSDGHDDDDVTLRDALQNLTVGLFRRGCSDNTSSIISKQVIGDSNDQGGGRQRRQRQDDYPFEIKGNVVVGRIPFFSPRTPGNVVLRLYWKNWNNDNNEGDNNDDSRYTLATGPTLAVQVMVEADVEPTLRFILGNFKAKNTKGTSSSLSSAYSLAMVLENLHLSSYAISKRERWDGAKRATWGCLCESRKVYEMCGREYVKTRNNKLVKLESEVNELRQQVAESDEADDDLIEKLKDRTSALMGGRASNERKWREAQVAFASILKALTTNPSCQVLASRDVIARAQLELELWCPLCESFAPSPFNSDKEAVCVNIDDLPQAPNGAQFRTCTASREEMERETLGFVPSFKSLEQVLAPKEKRRQGQTNVGMNPTAVGALNGLSAAMGELYQNVYMVSDRIHKQRELVRSHVESIVARCDAFPSGTRVVVFGSAANGFGSPSSDLDMCLQLPPNTKLSDEDDATGAKAMSKLAELLEQGGLEDVNTERLTARIPIVMFSCPRPMAADDQDRLVECDVSMQNPLACLNTSLLLTYSQIHPITRVLASIIKRWAKSRDINSPPNHTLSTYGYILMLLHFLTYHKRKDSGLVTTIDKRGQSGLAPLLPNLQWMDPRWPESPSTTPYLELSEKPKQFVVHPFQNDFAVNTYFYRLNDPAALSRLQQRFPGQDLSLSILLASYFRYYAYEFDYKRHVVSLNTTATRGMMDREEKAELDCWKAYGTGLSIEDPFETFYDVAHVVKGSNFHRIRNEFAMAYTKIVCVATGDGRSWNKNVTTMSGSDLIDWICEPYVKESQQQEPEAQQTQPQQQQQQD